MITAFFSSHIFRRELSRVTHESRRAGPPVGPARGSTHTCACTCMCITCMPCTRVSRAPHGRRRPTGRGSPALPDGTVLHYPLVHRPRARQPWPLRTVTRADNDIHDTRRTNKTRRHVRAAPRFSRALFIARNRDLRENPKHATWVMALACSNVKLFHSLSAHTDRQKKPAPRRRPWRRRL